MNTESAITEEAIMLADKVNLILNGAHNSAVIIALATLLGCTIGNRHVRPEDVFNECGMATSHTFKVAINTYEDKEAKRNDPRPGKAN